MRGYSERKAVVEAEGRPRLQAPVPPLTIALISARWIRELPHAHSRFFHNHRTANSSPMIKIMLGFAAWASAVPEDPGEAAKRIEAATPPNRLWNIGRLGGCGGGLELAGSYIVAFLG